MVLSPSSFCPPLAAGGVPPLKFLVGSDAVCNLIRENKCFQIPSVLQSGGRFLRCTALNGDLAGWWIREDYPRGRAAVLYR